MKHVLTFSLIIALASMFTSCGSDDDDNKVEVTRTYKLYVNAGEDSGFTIIGSEAPTITELSDFVHSSAKTITEKVIGKDTKFQITGKGGDETEALLNADQQAMEVYNKYVGLADEQIKMAQINFELRRKSYAESIKKEPSKYKCDKVMGLFLIRNTTDITTEADKVIKEGDKLSFKAQGGQDYSK